MYPDKIDYTDLLGKPYQLGARGPEFYDCWGICLELGKRAGLALPKDFTPDNTEAQSKSIKHYRDTQFIKLDRPEPYCIAVYSLELPPPYVDHCGFVLEDCRNMVHILKQHSVARVRLNNRILLPKLNGYYKLCS